FFQAADGIRDATVTGVQTCALPIYSISGFEGGLRCSKEMLASGRPFTAVLAFDDLTALGVIRGLTDAGLRIPCDCSVVGFDDVQIGRASCRERVCLGVVGRPVGRMV